MTPDVLIIGHAARDLVPGGWRLGGTVAFAALTAAGLELRPAVVTAAPADVLGALAAAAPGVPVAALVCDQATTFENRYDTAGHRRQYVRGQAATLRLSAVPDAWRLAPLVLLAPLAGEVDPELAGAFPAARVAATPQGWLRQWDADGLVRPGPWPDAERILPHLAALILSREDVLPAADAGAPAGDALREAEARIARWAQVAPLVIVTRGAEGADLLLGSAREHFPSYPVTERDPTGAGDVFATAFLCQLLATGDPRAAVDFANCAASFVVEREGTAGIPTRAQVLARLRSRHQAG